MGFGAKWNWWIEALLFKSSMSILVNGSPSKDFEVFRGIRQGEPLSSFLFLLVAEGLATLMNKASILGEFRGFQVIDQTHFEII